MALVWLALLVIGGTFTSAAGGSCLATPAVPLRQGARTEVHRSSMARPESEGQGELLATVALAPSCTLMVQGLRFAGSLDVRWLPPGPPGATPQLDDRPLDHRPLERLEFEQAYDASSSSWGVSVALQGRGPVHRVVLLCDSCTAGGGAASISGVLAAADLPSSSSGSAQEPEGGVVLLVLSQAILPPAAASSGTSQQQQQQQLAWQAGPRRAAIGRSLQQGADGLALEPCSSASAQLSLEGTTHQFEHCLDATPIIGGTYQLFYTSAPGGPSLKAGLRVGASGGWVGLGFPLMPYTMQGSSAVIVKPTPGGGVDVDGYILAAYDQTVVRGNKGKVPLTDASAGRDEQGNLVAVFTLPPDIAQKLATPGPIDLIYAIGPMGPDGDCSSHATGAYPYGPLKASFQAGPPASLDGLSPSADPPGGAVGGAPATAVLPPPLAGSVPASGSVPAGGAPVPLGESPGAVHGAGVPPGSGGGQSGACSLTVGSQPVEFAACAPVSGIGQDYQLFWSVQPSPTSPGKSLLTVGMSAVSSGYVAVGVPVNPGQMIGASAMVLKANSSSPTGASLIEYFLAAKDPSAVQPGGNLRVSNVSAAAAGGGRLVGTFQMEIDGAGGSSSGGSSSGAGAGRKLLQGSGGQQLPLIFSAGRLDPSGGLTQHDTYGSSTLDLSAGSTIGVSSRTTPSTTLKNAHGWLMAIGWGVLVPCGIVAARSFKDVAPPYWFMVHRVVQMLGLTLGIIGLALGFKIRGTWATPYTVHRNLGVAVTVLGCTQLTALAWRPQKGEKYRTAWEYAHHWVGRAAAACAIGNIYYGIIHVRQVGTWAWATYTAILAAIVVTSIGKDTWDWATGGRRTNDAKAPAVKGNQGQEGGSAGSSDCRTFDAGGGSSSNLKEPGARLG